MLAWRLHSSPPDEHLTRGARTELARCVQRYSVGGRSIAQIALSVLSRAALSTSNRTGSGATQEKPSRTLGLIGRRRFAQYIADDLHSR
jgi:hypothetical protein